MNGWVLFLKGMGLGISIAAPVGPIGVLCIQRTLKKGFPSGFFRAWELPRLICCMVHWQVRRIVAGNHLVRLQTPLRIVGGSILILMGVRAFFQRNSRHQHRQIARAGRGLFLHLPADTYQSDHDLFLCGGIRRVGVDSGTPAPGRWDCGVGVFVGSMPGADAQQFGVAAARRFKPQFYKVINKIRGGSAGGVWNQPAGRASDVKQGSRHRSLMNAALHGVTVSSRRASQRSSERTLNPASVVLQRIE
jgi:hypothetical protein